jgi:hypothetical protein
VGVRRRAVAGGLLAGLGQALSSLGESRVTRRQLADQRGYEEQKIQAQREAQAKHDEDQVLNQIALKIAEGDPAVAPRLVNLAQQRYHKDFSYLMPSALSQSSGLVNRISQAKTPLDLPADVGTELEAINPDLVAPVFGSVASPSRPAESPDLPPTLSSTQSQPIINPNIPRIEDLMKQRQAQLAADSQRVLKLKGDESYATAAGANRAEVEQAPFKLGQDVARAEALAPIDVRKAGESEGARRRAGLEPDIVQGETRAAAQKAGAEASARAQAEAAVQGLPGLSKEAQTAALQLMDNFRTDDQPFKVREDSFRSIRAAVTQPSAAGDLSLIFGFMRLLDPGSTVREGEFANAQNAAGVPERIRALANRVSSGERLSGAQRQDFVRQAQENYRTHLVQHKRLEADYIGRATALGVPPAIVIRQPDPALERPVTPGSTLDHLLNAP